MSKWSELSLAVRACVESSFRDVVEGNPHDEVIGCAILTDDDLSGFFVSFCTGHEVESGGDDFLFVPTDWELGSARDHDQTANDLLARIRTEMQLDHGAYIERAFASLVEGATGFRASGKLREDGFLTVGSTDPSPLHEQWEQSATTALNSEEVVDRLRRWQLTNARGWLEEILLREPPRTYAEEDLIVRLETEIQELTKLL